MCLEAGFTSPTAAERHSPARRHLRATPRAAQAKYARLARAAGLGGSADTVALRNLKNGLIRLRKDLGLPQTLSQAGAPPAQVWAATGEIVEAVLADPCCKTNPVPVEDYLVRRVLEEVTGNF